MADVAKCRQQSPTMSVLITLSLQRCVQHDRRLVVSVCQRQLFDTFI